MHDIEAAFSKPASSFRSRLLLVGADGAAGLDMAASILRRRGHQVEIDRTWTGDFSTIALYDLVVLELDVSEPNALLFLGRLRDVSTVPLLVLVPITARNRGIYALELGADSFVVIPFDRRELVARSEALIRRYRQVFSSFGSVRQAGAIARSRGDRPESV